MTTDRITTRNKANARKSTGPKSAAGKAVVAGNARKHGVTGRPDPGRVKAWLAVVLNRPQITPDDLAPRDERGFLALALAEAETRLVAVEQALAAAQDDPHPEPHSLLALSADLEDVRALAEEMLDFALPSQKGFYLNLSVVNDRRGIRTKGPSMTDNRRKVLRRYHAEARSRRRRAFTAWINYAPNAPGN
jgi:hypothetical protein